MDKLMANYEAWIHNEHTGEVIKLIHFSKQNIKKQIIKILTYPCGLPYECKTCLGDEKDINFEIHFYNENFEKTTSDFSTKDLNVYIKELNKYLTKQ